MNSEIFSRCADKKTISYSDELFQSASELRLYTIAVKAFERLPIIVSSNEHLFNLFEADIILRFDMSSTYTSNNNGSTHNKITHESDSAHDENKMICDNGSDNDLNRDSKINNNGINEDSYKDSKNNSIDNTKYTIINIEVDGLSHKREKGMRYQMLRDKYLKSRGVSVVRMRSEDNLKGS